MTLKEAADYLKMSEKTVTELARTGKIPASRRARVWQFDRATIEAWKSSRVYGSVAEQQLPAEAAGLAGSLTLCGVIRPDRINVNLRAADRDGILRELVALVIEPQERRAAETLFQALKAREDLCPTCVSEAVAIPHARNALVGLVDSPVLAYGRHRAGVDFGAIDGKPTHHFFLLCAPNVREHLALLARLARLVNMKDFRDKLGATEEPGQVIALIADAEQTLKG